MGEFLPGDTVSDLVSQASSLLAREAISLPSIPLGTSNGGRGTKVGVPVPDSAFRFPRSPGPIADPDRLRRQAHEMVETLLEAFSPKAESIGDRVPLVQCVAPVAPGDYGRATLRLANDEATPFDVTLYCTNFVADSGYDIASLRVTVLPQRLTIPPKGESTFEIKIAVPQQTPTGIYSGLIQATGTRYVKAVLSVEVT
jgi:hypothetical protein